MRLKRLSNKDPEAWRDWPALRRSISEAAAGLGQRTAETVLDKVLACFAFEGHADLPADKQGTMAVWYVLDDDGRIVAHLLATEDRWDGEKVIYVNQGWIINPKTAKALGQSLAPTQRRDIREMIAEELDNYARSRECRQILMYTRRHTPRFWKTAGYTPYRIVYHRELS